MDRTCCDEFHRPLAVGGRIPFQARLVGRRVLRCLLVPVQGLGQALPGGRQPFQCQQHCMGDGAPEGHETDREDAVCSKYAR